MDVNISSNVLIAMDGKNMNITLSIIKSTLVKIISTNTPVPKYLSVPTTINNLPCPTLQSSPNCSKKCPSIATFLTLVSTTNTNKTPNKTLSTSTLLILLLYKSTSNNSLPFINKYLTMIPSSLFTLSLKITHNPLKMLMNKKQCSSYQSLQRIWIYKSRNCIIALLSQTDYFYLYYLIFSYSIFLIITKNINLKIIVNVLLTKNEC